MPNSASSTASLGAGSPTQGAAPVGTSRIPAVVLVEETTASLEIAGLTLLDRLLVAMHRAGAGPITVVSKGQLPRLRRAGPLQIRFQAVSEMPKLDGPTLLASTSVLVQPADVRACLAAGAALLSNTGDPLPVGITWSANQGLAGLEDARRLPAEGVAWPVRDAAEARSAEAALWASLTSRSDGWVDRLFNRPCGRPLSKVLIHTAMSPNTVSVISILIGVLAAACFAQGTDGMSFLGAILFQLSAIIDCVDGDIARVLFKESWLGKWLDLAGDQVVHVAFFAGLAWGVAKTGTHPEALWLGASAIAGALISFAVVLRGMYCRSGENTRLQRMIDAATNRDFSVLVLLLAIVQQVHWFLWMAAVGSHVFWVAALILQSGTREDRRLAR